MAKIAYTDKSKTGTGAVKQWRDVDANEVKESVNHLYESRIHDWFTMRESTTVTNTTEETTLIGTGDGSTIIDKDYLIDNAYIQIRSKGYISTGNSGTNSTLRIKFGGQTLIASLGTIPTNLNNVAIAMDAVIRLDKNSLEGATLSGFTLIQGGHGITTVSMRSLNVPILVPINLDVDCGVEHTYQWSTASVDNSITLTAFEILVK